MDIGSNKKYFLITVSSSVANSVICRLINENSLMEKIERVTHFKHFKHFSFFQLMVKRNLYFRIFPQNNFINLPYYCFNLTKKKLHVLKKFEHNSLSRYLLEKKVMLFILFSINKYVKKKSLLYLTNSFFPTLFFIKKFFLLHGTCIRLK